MTAFEGKRCFHSKQHSIPSNVKSTNQSQTVQTLQPRSKAMYDVDSHTGTNILPKLLYYSLVSTRPDVQGPQPTACQQCQVC